MPARRTARIPALAALCLAGWVTLPGAAQAQPSNSPLNTPIGAPAPAGPPVSGTYKSPNTALALSLGGTLGSLALVSVGGAAQNEVMSTAGSLGIWIAPSFGHWYAGRGWTPGLKARLYGAGAVFVGVMWVAVDCIGSSCGDDFHPGFALAIGGGGAFFGGMIHDIATAPRAAREHNARRTGRIENLTVRPTLGSGKAGLSLSGRF